ncbi:MAG: hypothetical protein H7X99_03690 [Saprospiraceae bacterium]|nr:hypothetical protein [Saprospiraceae bacterium]
MNQNQVYSRYLYQMLLEYGIVAIPGMGTFSLNSIESAFDSERSFLSPPVTTVEFSTLVNEKYLFAGQLFQAGMSNDEALLLQSLIINDHEVAIKDNTPFEMDGLGTVKNQKFHQKKESVFNRYFGLVPINVTAIPSFLKRNHPLAESSSWSSSNGIKSDYTPQNVFVTYFWPLLLAVLTILLIIFWFLSSSSDVPHEGEIVVLSEQNQSDTPALLKPTINEDSLMSNIDSILASNTLKDDNQSDLSQNQNNSSPNSAKKENGTSLEGNERKQNQKSCIVIVGAFKRKKNADMLMKKITSKGFETYTEISNGLRRVGITYDCANKDPEEFKSSIKKQFNRDAWHLHDTL